METEQQIKRLIPRKKETGDNQLNKEPIIWTFKFGKHKDAAITTVIKNDPGYIEWLLKQEWLNEKLKGYILSKI